MNDQQLDTDGDTSLISARIATTDLEALRLVAATEGTSVAHEIRTAIAERLHLLRTDPEFVDRVRAQQAALAQLVGQADEQQNAAQP